MEGEQRIGLLGGTFDPVHIGHLAVAAEVKETLILDSVWFMPAAIPPHKKKHSSGQAISSFEDRAAMLEKALGGRVCFFVSRIESERPQPSYTIDTLTRLRQQLGSRAKLFFIMGGDAFAEIATWKDYDRLLIQADFVVITRPAFQFNKAEEVVRQCFKKYRYHPRESVWLPEDGKGGKIYFPKTKPIAVSSTEIRRMVQAGRPIQQMVPPEVEVYIRGHRLYRDVE